MNWKYTEPCHVSRDALIIFAWSAPMRDLAARVGISDVGLRKLLRSHGIVTPPQGHWNKVHAGRNVQDPPQAAPRGPGESGRIVLDERFQGIIEQAPPIPADGPFASSEVPEVLEILRAAEHKAIGRVAVSRNLHKVHRGLVKLLQQEDLKREKAQQDRWRWHKPAFDTPLGQRKLRILNALFWTLERRGHTGSAWEREGTLEAQYKVGDQRLSLSFTVVGKHGTETVAGYRRPAQDLPASTPLGLSLTRKFRTGIKVSWQDDATGKLEARLAEIAADLIVAGEAPFRQGLVEQLEMEEEHRKWEEQQRQKRLAELDAERLENLRTSGKLLAQAEEIRALVKRVKAAVVEGNTTISQEDLAEWEEWACRYTRPVVVLSASLAQDHLSRDLAGKVRVIDASPRGAMQMLQSEGHGRVYVDGGLVIQSFLRAGLIEDMVITRAPVLLGQGRSLFGDIAADIPLLHEETKSFPSGLVQSRYRLAA